MTRSYLNRGKGEVLGWRVTILGSAVGFSEVRRKPRSTGSLLSRSMSLRRPFEKACGMSKSDSSVKMFIGRVKSLAPRRT